MCNVISFCTNELKFFCLSLLVGPSSVVPPKRKKGTKKNEPVHPTGTVHAL